MSEQQREIDKLDELLARAKRLTAQSPLIRNNCGNTFRRAMADAGLICDELPIADGEIHRFHVEGDRPGSKNGWYALHGDRIPAGSFGSWKTGETLTWCAKRTETMTDIERAEYSRRIERAKVERERAKKKAQAEAKTSANEIWETAKSAPADYPYLVKKGIKPYDLRVYDETLVIPMRDTSAVIHSLQSIDAEGNKRFLPEGTVRGHHYTIGKLTESLYLCEGFATGASIHEATGCGVVIAFDCGNLLPVAKAIRKKYPDQALVIAGDDDARTDGNPGKTNASKAAEAVGAKVVMPKFKDTSSKPSDFNDLFELEGLDTVREQLANPKELKTSGSETNQPADASKAIAELAELSPIDYEQRRDEEADKLSIRVSILDKEVGRLRAIKNGSDMAGSAVLFEELEPWSDSVDGAELLNELVSAVKRHVVLLAYTPEAVALWILGAHAHDAASISAILAITSPDKRCGKSTLLILLEGVTPRSLLASNLTVATLFRAIEEYRPTLLVDEADTFLKNNDELRGILNSGHIRNGARVLRTVSDNHELRTFNTWSPKAIALIGNMPPTLMDRSIVIPMRRKRPNEVIERLRLDQRTRFKDLARRCARWAADNMEKLRRADPDIPESLHDRAADNWRPLLAIADVAGGDWPKRAREAAKVLTAGDDGESAGVLLLRDLQALFKEREIDRIVSAELVEALIKMEERPWPEWKAGKPITVRQVARLLNPFGITPKNIKVEKDKVLKGYELTDCDDAFGRYLVMSSATPLPDGKNSGLRDFRSATDSAVVADGNLTKPLKNKCGSGVADQTPPEAGENGNGQTIEGELRATVQGKI